MAAEARAMLDALMGADRDTSHHQDSMDSHSGGGGGGGHGSNGWAGGRRGNKKSCYDRDICPLYCAWGVDIFDLFTNTKSDLGPNPYIVQEDAHEEFKSLPDHEKDRLGYEHMLYRKLGDLVRNCDRTVSRNKEKLRAEVAKAARARGAATNRIDPVTEVKEELLQETAECLAELELREEEVERLLENLMSLDQEWNDLWNELQKLQRKDGGEGQDKSIEEDWIILDKDVIENEESKKPQAVEKSEEKEEGNTEMDKSDNKGEKKDEEEASKDKSNDVAETKNTQNDITASEEENKLEEKEGDSDGTSKLSKIKDIKIRLHKISSEQQKLISSLATITSSKIMPLRENLHSLQKQIYYIRTDTSSDKTVCEISGNFMSSRDAEERIAAHYAGKQYVGWKMVRDKHRELHKKFSAGGRGGHGMMGGPPRGAPYGARGGPGGYHGPPPHGHVGGFGDRGPPGGGGYQRGGQNDRHRRDRSRSRDRDQSSRPHRGGGDRWERDRHPSGGGGHSGGYRNRSGGGRRDDRGHGYHGGRR